MRGRLTALDPVREAIAARAPIVDAPPRAPVLRVIDVPPAGVVSPPAAATAQAPTARLRRGVGPRLAFSVERGVRARDEVLGGVAWLQLRKPSRYRAVLGGICEGGGDEREPFSRLGRVHTWEHAGELVTSRSE